MEQRVNIVQNYLKNYDIIGRTTTVYIRDFNVLVPVPPPLPEGEAV
jgi:hypothetical protein